MAGGEARGEDTRSGPRARVVWVLIDGVGDVGVPALGRQTPLQVCPASA